MQKAHACIITYEHYYFFKIQYFGALQVKHTYKPLNLTSLSAFRCTNLTTFPYLKASFITCMYIK